MNEQMIPLKELKDNPYQGRDTYDGIEDLARTIAVSGLQQAPKARRNGTGWELKFGHRRKRAFDWLAKNFKKEGLPDRYDGYSVMPVEIEELSDREMFDVVVIENVQRDDLKPTEKARLLKRYQEQFPSATSREIGLVFGMNESTARGMVRLLDLPASAQQALDEGKITQATARTLLSVQRIAPAGFIDQAVCEIEKQAGNHLPNDVLADMVERLQSVEELWDEQYRQGKPKAGDHGWDLDMKKFPNSHLPAMSENEVAANEANVEHLLNPPACTACPFYSKIQGSHFCGLKPCFQRKTIAWKAYLLERASKASGIPVYDPEKDGTAQKLESYSDKKLFESKSPGLRLIAGRGYQSFPGLNDDVVLVVATGEALNKLHHRSSTSGGVRGGKKTEKEKAAARALKVYKPLRKQLLWMFTACAAPLFASVPYEMLRRIDGWNYLGVDVRPPDDVIVPDSAKVSAEKVDYLRRLIIWRMCKADDYQESLHRTDLTKLARRLEALAKQWGVKYPKSLTKLAEQYEEQVRDAARVVAAETKAAKKGTS